MLDLETLGVSHDELLGIGESGTGKWEVYCLTQSSAQKLARIGTFKYAGQHNTKVYLLGCQICTIHVHWLPLQISNDEVDAWVSTYNDEIENIIYEHSEAPKARGLLTGIRRISCLLQEGVEKTDIPYDCEMMAFDRNKYRILVSVDGRKPRCLNCKMSQLQGSSVIAHHVAKWPVSISLPIALIKVLLQ